ncbi:FkbM family methyltransferase [Luteibacter aegosomaticola]|uniref:FkbM family methyltransferase n=1 Tax=Luteibacter aegosomaticola TaxID=2911538 RepID=UPI001FF74A10|nr:FkbM family methyltransferase [Luteibacter aegosomaticola]UPG89258.1 FkbM family methyltransferase [Luteibacter aegosomaticola]
MEATVKIADNTYRMESDDEYLRAAGADFEPEMIALFRHFAKGTVLDVGANIGFTALAFAQMADVVHCFEPSPSTFRFLTGNTAGQHKLCLHQFGLGDAPGKFELTFSPFTRAGGFVSNQTQACEGHIHEEIEVRRLDDVATSLDLAGLDFVKIDVEGFESHVLRGGIRTIHRYKPVVVLELNHWCLNAFQRTSVPEFLDYLRGIFPKLYAVQGGTYLNLHEPNDSYKVMYYHILQMKYATIVCAFDDDQVAGFRAAYEYRVAD